MTSLGPQFLYHGNFAGLDKGDRVESAATRGTQANFAMQSGKQPDVAFASEREGVAWDFAHMAGERSAKRDKTLQARSSVAKVEPHPQQERGRFHEAHPKNRGEHLSEWVAPHYDVAERIDIKPGHQGTFPEVNWNQFKKNPEEHAFNDSMNHPTDDHIEYGHPGGQMNQSYLKNFGRQFTTMPETDPYQPSIPGLEQYRIKT